MTVKAGRNLNLDKTIDLIAKEKLLIPYFDPSMVEWSFDHLASIEAQDTNTVSGSIWASRREESNPIIQ